MLSNDLESVCRAITELAGKLDIDSSEILRLCRLNLESAIETAMNMENNLYPIMEEK